MKKILAILLMLALTFSLAACRGQSQKPVLKVGTEPTFPPFEMTDDKNQITGFDIDLIKAIAADQKLEVEINNLSFDGLIMALGSGSIDIIASGMTITTERAIQVDFTDPYINAGLALAVANSNNTIKSIDDLKGKKVAVQIGTTGANKADELLKAGEIGAVKTFKTCDLLMQELINGGVDAVINDLPVTEAYMAKQSGKIKMVGEPLTSEDYGFAVKKGNTELLNKLNQGLKNVKANGTYDQLKTKYFK